jgi:glycosyltransferase involved in cell wall biosynthesis
MTAARILYAVTDPITALSFLRGQLAYLRSQGFEPHLACARTPELEAFAAEEGVILHNVPLSRGWLGDPKVRSVVRAMRVLRNVRPDVLNYSTPKAATVWAVASWFARPRVVVFLLRGLRLEGERPRSAAYVALWLMEFLAARTADVTVCVSESLRRRAITLRLVRRTKAVVLGAGSSNGVDTGRFRPPTEAERRRARNAIGVPPAVCVVGFVGRLARDKGIDDLLDAVELSVSGREIRCVLVGSAEPDYDLQAALAQRPAAAAVTVLRSSTPAVEEEYAAFDIFVLPSHREGMSNALLEAQAMGVACITTTATGCADALDAGGSGLVVRTSDPQNLAEAIVRLADDPSSRRAMGAAGRERVITLFQPNDVWRRFVDLYRTASAPNNAVQTRELRRER